MTQVSEEKKEEVYQLVEKQKKATISWLAIITNLTEEQIVTIAMDLGLTVENNHVLFPSETKNGKRRIQIQKNVETLLQQAINERVLREYLGGDDARDAKAIATAAALYAAGGGVVAAGIGLSMLSKPTDPSKLKFGKVETCRCLFDGDIEYSISKADKMPHTKETLYQVMKEQYGQNSQCLNPIRYYYQMVLIPEHEELLTESQIRETNSLCEVLDQTISKFCTAIVEKSVTRIDTNRRNSAASYSVLLTAGKKVESTEKFMPFYKYSLFLSYRTLLTKQYYDLLQLDKLPNVMKMVLNDTQNRQQLCILHLQYVFAEFLKNYEREDVKENSEVLRLIVSS